MGERVNRRITSPGPKRILALDGGGIRGMITVEVLAEIENLLHQKTGRAENFRLADYFDFVAGPVRAQSSRPVFRSACRCLRSASFTSVVARRCLTKRHPQALSLQVQRWNAC
jgi:hypothetical protein